ncbi:MAG TPA: hypothetical protein VJR26_15255 [Candidatus Acidoferrales bacterium]|nr:hypothetical protein [Candidatus Acidoferrales bacterium]
MALFVLLVVGVVVAQTWLDWRDTRKGSRIPDWARGTALASVLAVSLAVATSYASAWIEGDEPLSPSAGSRLLWPQICFLICTMGLLIAAARNKRHRWVFVAAGVVVGVLWVGFMLSF